MRAWMSGLSVLVMMWAGAAASAATTMRVEVETGGVTADADARQRWEGKDAESASGGRMLSSAAGARGNSARINVVIPEAGAYRVWVRYRRAKPVCVGFYTLLRDDSGEEVALHFMDWSQWLPREQPYEEITSWAGERTGWIWEPFDVVFERPMRATLEFGGYRGGTPQGARLPEREVDAVVLTTDKALDPEKLDLAALAAIPGPPEAVPAVAAPKGMVVSAGLPANVAGFSAITDPQRRFRAGLINNASYYDDYTRHVRMGFTHDHVTPNADMLAAGVQTQGHVEAYRGDARELGRQYPSSEGRFVNAEGKVSAAFSYDFPPLVESSETLLRQRMKDDLANSFADCYGQWRTSVEDGGLLDYSSYSVAAFRKWLAGKHGDIATLNKRWGADYADFDAIQPPKSFEEGRAGWLEFRDFAGWTYAQAIARQMPVIHEMDPRRRPCTGANSSLDLFSPYFSRLRPIDWDQLVAIALKTEPMVAWDTYCADDQLACEADLLASFAEDKRILIQEWSNHAVDPRIAARSYWTYVSKGAAGIFLFMFEEGTYHATYPKWALLNPDRTPKAKLAAYADAAQEVHRLEPMLMAARRRDAVKPVAMYWSRIDLSVAQPHESLYGCAIDSPFHIYRTLRSLGYPVRWITPRQVREGQLKDVGALVLADCQFIPRDVATAMRDWVEAGGVIAGDSWPGAFDEYGQPQGTLAEVFGVRKAAPPRKAGSQLAVQESTQGYGEVTDAAVERKEIHTLVEEFAHQPGATHPVAKALGEFMVSGIAPARIECVSGTVVAMSHRGLPGFVINRFGKGTAVYSSMLLGTIWESSGTRYEWDTTHAGLSYQRFWRAFLDHAGVRPGSRVAGLAERVAAKLRIEWPLVTPEGNLLVGLTSMNDLPVEPFELELVLPKEAPGPFVNVLVTTGGSRRLTAVQATVQEGRLRLPMPGFDTHAMVLALHDGGPLVAVETPALKRGIAHLGVAGSGATFDVTATVFNPSTQALPAGTVALTIPAGWCQDRALAAVEPLAPGQSRSVTFKVQTPALAGPTRMRQLLARYTAGQVTSTPATQVVWWNAPADAQP